MEQMILDGLKMEILDICQPYFLLLSETGDYLIVKNEITHDYTIVNNFKSDRDLAYEEFTRRKVCV